MAKRYMFDYIVSYPDGLENDIHVIATTGTAARKHAMKSVKRGGKLSACYQKSVYKGKKRR